MKLIISLTIVLLFLNLNACLSQKDPSKKGKANSPNNENSNSKINSNSNNNRGKNQLLEKEDKKIVQPTISTEIQDIKSPADDHLKGEEAEMRLSVISYYNVVDVPIESIEEKVEKSEDNVDGKDWKEKEKNIVTADNLSIFNNAKVPVQGQKVKLMIQNNHAVAMWYIMPVSGEKEMPQDGKFTVNPDATPPFLGKKYGTEEQYLVELIYHGTNGQSFRAFYVEAGSSMLFRNYDLGNYKEGEHVPFWSAQELVVDNKIKLKNWLPFPVLSSPNVVLQSTLENEPPKWVNLSQDADFSAGKFYFIQAEGVQQYQIPVGTIR